MVSHNSQEYISQAIESILKQDYKNWELIIVDNGSNDNTRNIINSYLLKEDRIRLYLLDYPNQPQARNIALKKSRGDFIAVLDSDDVAKNNRLVEQYKIIKNNPKIDFVGSYVEVISSNNKKLRIEKYPTNSSVIKFSFLLGNPLAHSSVIFRRKKNILYDEDLQYSQDREFFTRYIKNNTYKIIPIPLTCFRVHEGQFSKYKKDVPIC